MQPTQQVSLPLSQAQSDWLKTKIRDIPDFPAPGILFRDITPLLKDHEALAFAVDALAHKYRPIRPDYVAALDARGFIFGGALAYVLGCGFIPIRKPGRLPYKVEKTTYELEYRSDGLEIHEDALHDPSQDRKKNSVVLVDDLLATGGTAMAAIELLNKVGAHVIGAGFVIELCDLDGRSKLSGVKDAFSLLQY